MKNISLLLLLLICTTAISEHLTDDPKTQARGNLSPEFNHQLSEIKSLKQNPFFKDLAYGIYTRGNDDVFEEDENHISNFRTANHLVALQTLDEPEGLRLNLVYDGQLKTDEFHGATVVNLAHFGVTETNIPGASKNNYKKFNLIAMRDKDRLFPGSIFSATLGLGRIPKNDKEEHTYEGKARIRLGALEKWEISSPTDRQEVSWKVTVREGKVISSSVSLLEFPRPRRTSKELLHLVGSSDSKATLVEPHPIKVGEAHGVGVVGDPPKTN